MAASTSTSMMPSFGTMTTTEKAVVGAGAVGGWMMGARILGGLIGGPIGAVVGVIAGNMLAKKL